MLDKALKSKPVSQLFADPTNKDLDESPTTGGLRLQKLVEET
jgi:hypothetical protein